MGTFSYDSLNLLARYIKLLPKLTTDSLSQIRLTVLAEEHWAKLVWISISESIV